MKTADDDSYVETMRFSLAEICHVGRSAFQSQLAFFSFFAAANGVAAGWLVEGGHGVGSHDEDQGRIAGLFIVGTLLCAATFTYRVREIARLGHSFERLAGEISLSAHLPDILVSFPRKMYQRVSTSLAVACLFMAGMWLFALLESWGISANVATSWSVGMSVLSIAACARLGWAWRAPNAQ